MLMFTLLVAISSFNLTGFWHSSPDLSEGYESCYFFWDTGEYAYMESREHGSVLIGNWSLENDKLLLDLLDAVSVEGMPLNIRLNEFVLDLHTSTLISRPIISLDGEYFFLVERDPQSAIKSLVPTWGMTASERFAVNNTSQAITVIETPEIVRILENEDVEYITTNHSQYINISLSDGSQFEGTYLHAEAGEYSKDSNLCDILNLILHIKEARSEAETEEWIILCE